MDDGTSSEQHSGALEPMFAGQCSEFLAEYALQPELMSRDLAAIIKEQDAADPWKVSGLSVLVASQYVEKQNGKKEEEAIPQASQTVPVVELESTLAKPRNLQVDSDDAVQQDRHNKWINRQITCAAGSGNITWLLQVVQAHLDKMNLINFSTALHRVAKLALGCNVHARQQFMEHDSIRELQAAVVLYVAALDLSGSESPSTNITGGKPGPVPSDTVQVQDRMSEMRCLSIICWSCATLRIREESLFNRVARISEVRLAELKPFELSNMLWAFAKLSLGHASFFDSMSPSLLKRREGQFSPQCLSTLVWAFGTVKVYNAAVFASFAAEITAKAHTMAPQGIANTAWAFARVQRQEVCLFRALADAAVREDVIWTFKAQELSNTVWAFATVGLHHPQLFARIAEVTVSIRFMLPPQNVANMLWAYAKLMAASRSELFPALLEVATSRLGLYKPQEISAILWAGAKEVGCPVCRKFFLTVPRYFAHRLPEFTTQALACMVEAFSLAEVDVGDFFNAVMQESTSRISSFQPPSLCTFLRGIALKESRQQNNPALAMPLRIVSQHIASRLGEMQPHNLSHVQQSMELLPPSACPECLQVLTVLKCAPGTKEGSAPPSQASIGLNASSHSSLQATWTARPTSGEGVGRHARRRAQKRRAYMNAQLDRPLWQDDGAVCEQGQPLQEIAPPAAGALMLDQCAHGGLPSDDSQDSDDCSPQEPSHIAKGAAPWHTAYSAKSNGKGKYSERTDANMTGKAAAQNLTGNQQAGRQARQQLHKADIWNSAAISAMTPEVPPMPKWTIAKERNSGQSGKGQQPCTSRDIQPPVGPPGLQEAPWNAAESEPLEYWKPPPILSFSLGWHNESPWQVTDQIATPW